ncbi:hypothetical protein AU072_06345 [Mycolicibacterium novocastrense]|nr:hypothetical protein AU072_06345 [Mycolicibacterium novocastrense]
MEVTLRREVIEPPSRAIIQADVWAGVGQSDRPLRRFRAPTHDADPRRLTPSSSSALGRVWDT